jgi:hypothetical protein
MMMINGYWIEKGVVDSICDRIWGGISLNLSGGTNPGIRLKVPTMEFSWRLFLEFSWMY